MKRRICDFLHDMKIDALLYGVNEIFCPFFLRHSSIWEAFSTAGVHKHLFSHCAFREKRHSESITVFSVFVAKFG